MQRQNESLYVDIFRKVKIKTRSTLQLNLDYYFKSTPTF